MINLHTFYTALLSGVLKKHNENEYWWEYENGPITVEMADISQQRYIVRRYWENGNKVWEKEFQHNQQHGKHIEWYRNGNKWWEVEYQNEKLHGKYIEWWRDGSKTWEEEYQNGERIK